jgi:hypothetical protein
MALQTLIFPKTNIYLHPIFCRKVKILWEFYVIIVFNGLCQKKSWQLSQATSLLNIMSASILFGYANVTAPRFPLRSAPGCNSNYGQSAAGALALFQLAIKMSRSLVETR